MALMSADAAATGLLQAILALSAFHMGSPEEALNHKVKAIAALSQSFNTECLSNERKRLTQFATCMMLCVYSVSDEQSIGGVL